MKLTRHNGRAGKNGAYNPKHNDRSFNINNSEHMMENEQKEIFTGIASMVIVLSMIKKMNVNWQTHLKK